MNEKTKQTLQQFLLILLILFGAIVLIWAVWYTDTHKIENWVVVRKLSENVQSPINDENALPGATSQASEAIKGVGVPQNSHLAQVTYFADECPTTWCKAHLGGERENVVAVNYKKFGKPTKVYIATWDKWYDVISNTDGKTDIDIWCDLDTVCQQQVGSRKLMVSFKY
jgi:hypothetical protein